jgi:hypothetical protein
MDAHVVEDERAPLEAVGEHVDRGVLPRHELPVDPDGAIDPRFRSGGHRPNLAVQGLGSQGGLGRVGAAGWEILRDHHDTRPGLEPTPERENRMLKKARDKATEILVISADLYRDMTLSALRLVGRRA